MHSNYPQVSNKDVSFVDMTIQKNTRFVLDSKAVIPKSLCQQFIKNGL
jgi:hypothetical protein